MHAGRLLESPLEINTSGKVQIALLGRGTKVNPDAVVRNASLIPWAVVQLQDSPAELS